MNRHITFLADSASPNPNAFGRTQPIRTVPAPGCDDAGGAPVFGPLGIWDWVAPPDLPPPVECPPGLCLTDQGALPDFVYLIDSGMVKKVAQLRDRRRIVTGLRSSGWIIDPVAAISQTPCATSCITATRTILRRVTLAQFLEYERNHIEFGRHVSLVLAREAQSNQRMNLELRLGSTRTRLERFTADMAVWAQHSNRGRSGSQLPLRLGEIAQLLAVTPEHLSRLMHELEESGALRRHAGGWIMPIRYSPSPKIHSATSAESHSIK
jgi:CRP-like cAMP-binding protein